jgi:hypothetical protein
MENCEKFDSWLVLAMKSIYSAAEIIPEGHNDTLLTGLMKYFVIEAFSGEIFFFNLLL